jgi:hypothetical protein
MNGHNEKIVDAVKKVISKSKSGTLFFISTFPEYDDEYVGKVLADCNRLGLIIRISNGIYLKPAKSKFGMIYPTSDEIVKAIAKRDKCEIIPTGNTSLNLLGLSTQVPMNTEYLTSGSTRIIKYAGRTIRLKHGMPKNFAAKGKITRILIQAMKAIGKENITAQDVDNIRIIMRKYHESDTMGFDLQVMPLWIKKIVMSIINETDKLKSNEDLAKQSTE